MIFFRCELREDKPQYSVTFDYADTLEEAIENCKRHLANPNLGGGARPTFWIWQEETGFDKDPVRLGSISLDGEFKEIEDEPSWFCDWCEKERFEGDPEHHRDDGPCSCVVYCSQDCIDAYHDFFNPLHTNRKESIDAP